MSREMKDSGIEWIEDIPVDWEVRKLGNVAALYIGNSIKDNEKENYADEKQAIPYIGTRDVNLDNTINYSNGMYVKKDDLSFKRAYQSSTLVCIEGGSAGRKIANLEQEVAFGNKLCCIDSKVILNKYIYYYVLSPSFSSGFYARITGLIPGVTLSELGQIEIVIPSIKTQQKIANLLDKKVAEIDHILNKTKESIEEYKKYKQSIITETVTKGLNPDVEMKDSGIEWVGEIPNNWEINSLNQVFTQLKNKNITMQEANLLSLSYGKIIRKDINSTDGLLPENFSNYNVIDTGDIVLRLTDLQNDHTSLRVGYVNEKGIITSAYITLRSKERINTEYFYLFLHSFDIYKGFYGLGSGVRQNLTFDGLKYLKLIIPPAAEQLDIIKYLDKKCSEIDNLTYQKQTLLTELESYKSSLIYEYVTGKRKV